MQRAKQSTKPARSAADPLASWVAGVSRVALVGAGLVMAPLAPAVEMINLPEGSVAIASDVPTLAETAEPTPTLAEAVEAVVAKTEAASTIADASVEQAVATDESVKKTSPRVAALPADGEQVLAESAKDTGPKTAKFHGVTPGTSTRTELIKAWGEPDRTAEAKGDTSGGRVLEYTLKPFKKVEALIESDTVSVVRVTLSDNATVAELTKRLRLQEITPVAIEDPTTAEPMAVSFPEKGLTILTRADEVAPSDDATSAKATHLVIEPLDARAFVLRCEQRPTDELTAKLADLDLALQINPADAHGHWLKAKQHLAGGEAAAAEEAAAESVRLEPTDGTFRLTYAEALLAAGEYDKAVIETRKVLDDNGSPEIVRAGAMSLMGCLAALGDKAITAKTIDFHNAAIEIADRLATSGDARERRIAKDVLVASHLAVAKEIARRDYADKAETVAEWIGRASGIAEERIASDEGGLELRLQVAREALAALSGLRPSKDPMPWVTEAQETADLLLSQTDDELFRSRVHWELGEAYQHAVRIEHLRGDAKQALSYGTRAIAELSSGAEPRTTSPAAERTVGQLYFYLGAVNAVHKQDHAEATGWYDKGRPILTAGAPDSDFVAPRREGEELVSMGVSYWNQDQRDLAIELTETGARWMERSVAAGVLKEKALAVPYGNLATMYQKLDNTQKAAEYDRRVKAVRGDDTPAKKQPSQPLAKRTPKPQQQARQTPRATTPTKQQPTKDRVGNRPSRLGLGRIRSK